MNAAIQTEIVVETGVQNWMVYMKMEIIKLDLHCSFIVNVATHHYLQKVVSRTLICVRIKYTVKQKLFVCFLIVVGWCQPPFYTVCLFVYCCGLVSDPFQLITITYN